MTFSVVTANGQPLVVSLPMRFQHLQIQITNATAFLWQRKKPLCWGRELQLPGWCKKRGIDMHIEMVNQSKQGSCNSPLQLLGRSQVMAPQLRVKYTVHAQCSVHVMKNLAPSRTKRWKLDKL